MGKLYVLLALSLASTLFISSEAEQCGRQSGNKRCPSCLCCSRWGWCGKSVDYCGAGCQSQCWGRLTLTNISDDGVVSIITQPLFDQMLEHRHDAACPARNFYTYDAFINAANAFSAFGTTGDLDTRKREIAAFFALTSHATNGGLPTAMEEPYAWGYCLKEVRGRGDYCNPTTTWPCVPGKQYHGRGPIQISHNYNYGPAGRAIGVDLLENPDLVANDAVISFKTALWFWMTPQSTNPSYHDIVTGGVKGELELFNGIDADVDNRTGFYRRYCNILGVSPGDNLDWAPHLVLPSAL